MTVRLVSVTYTSGDGATTVPSYLASPNGNGPHPAVLILRGVAGPDDGYTEISRADSPSGGTSPCYMAGTSAALTRRTPPCTTT